MPNGYLALVLHAHLPFVRHPDSEDYIEERWLFEAMTETYIPLLQVYQQLMEDGVDFHVTMSITPTLGAMLLDKLLQERFVKHLTKLIELSKKEIQRTEGDQNFHPLAKTYLAKFEQIFEFYQRCGGNLIAAFREIQDRGHLELITCAATHAFLPNVLTREALYAQIITAVNQHQELFHCYPKGIWLPECGYTPGVEEILQECGIEYFFTDSHAVSSADPSPLFGTLSPVITSAGVVVFPRDLTSSRQVWSAQEGYPGDFDYREYYRDIGYDLDMDIIGPYLPCNGIRVNTGIKYFRITGSGEEKKPYNFERAREKAALHAGDFIFNRNNQVEHARRQMGRTPLIVAPYDAELFGHWWYEGPIWLDILLRKIHFDQTNLKTMTPSEYMKLYSDYQECQLSLSSWGRDGFSDVWLQEENDWIYPALHKIEQRMVALADRFAGQSGLKRRALNQAARELMLAQSSDWAFIMDARTVVQYAVKRIKIHVNRFSRLYEMITEDRIQEDWLEALEQIDNLFPQLDFHVYQTRSLPISTLATSSWSAGPGLRVLMLAWEFPPMTVGGLSRHVYDLSRFLVRQGIEVHVFTTAVDAFPSHELVEAVHVHRVNVLKPDGGEFFHWVFQLNLALLDACVRVIEQGVRFDIIHAHDWLVFDSAKALKDLYNLTLVATIHATEHGRNNGIYSQLQHSIHNLEWKLTYEGRRVIVCSSYMKKEVEHVFQLPPEKIHVLPNGVDTLLMKTLSPMSTKRLAYAAEDELIVLFVGRLVPEKGLFTLFDAVPNILGEFPEVKFIVVGTGPLRSDLEGIIHDDHLEDRVLVTGFVSDEERNTLLQLADVAVFPSLYEPFGIVALEAMASGTAVVVSDTGGLADVVRHGDSGLKMYPGDAQSLATQVKQLLRDPELRLRLQVSAQQNLALYDWNHIAIQTLEVYKSAMRDGLSV